MAATLGPGSGAIATGTMQAAARRTSTPLIVVLIHGGPLDVEWLQTSPRVGAILSMWFPGQVGLCNQTFVKLLPM